MYDVGKTPMNINTPSYYPSTQEWGAFNSPGYSIGTEYDQDGIFSRAGSEYRPTTPQAENWGVKSEEDRQ